MKTRKFKVTGLQDLYNLVRTPEYADKGSDGLCSGTPIQNWHNRGYLGYEAPLRTSLAYAAWAAGVDNAKFGIEG